MQSFKEYIGARFDIFSSEGQLINYFGFSVNDMTKEELIVCLALCEKDCASKLLNIQKISLKTRAI